ncbi:MAG: glutathione peroxidase [Candidatus Scalindua sp. AMX11]|nr:MAG: glutathione peroxidase [Candidatus Scalindua sp.]NOG84647.1 glutathione peroxidase [Planctomycetota bacterium]RZV92453.1 MAG: glutathione peroxidase [Candidatus Scalindua sp. SCAELEC01]TDE66159.1 MAG: glutathione peroxidase [Candidatus Scalindua sp. AMX11]
MKERLIYEFTMNDIEGKPVHFDTYKGRVLFIVNVASKCGFTSQYKGLQELYEKYREHGFLILGFPANNFLHQEPGTDSDIKQFCSLHYHVSFPLFSKISVKGGDISHVYKFLTERETNPSFFGTIKWNFTKFLLDREGNVVDRFAPITKPNSKKVTRRIEEILGLGPRKE